LAGKGEQATDALNNQLVNQWQNIEKQQRESTEANIVWKHRINTNRSKIFCNFRSWEIFNLQQFGSVRRLKGELIEGLGK
jgi:hypothetical protein